MQLELIEARASGPSQPVALLFLHGICTSASLWQRFFLPASAAAGFDSLALSFRGHGRSEGRERLAYTTLSDYVADLEQTIERLARPLVVVGFSLGGAVLQAYLRRRSDLAGAVLLCSVPPHGLALAGLRLFFSDALAWSSLLAANQFGLRHSDPAALRRTLFSERIDPAVYAEFLTLAEEESPLIGMQLQGWPPFAPSPFRSDALPPMLVMGGGADRLVPPDEVRATARYYRTQATILPGMPHMLMLERNWQRAHDGLLAWLRQNVAA
ncbi:MAG: alpha/beta fold hydrolase [Kiloniellales bacterium]